MSHRTVIPLRRIFFLVNGGTPTSEPENWGGEVLWATPVDFGSNLTSITRTRRTLTLAGARSGSAIVPSDSLLISTRAPIGNVGITSTRMAFNQGCRALIPRCNADVRFFGYQLEARRLDLQAEGLGTTFLELSSERLASFPVAAPPYDEQRRIADFLDTETARLGQLVSLRGQQLRLAEAKRSSSMSKAFSRQDYMPTRLKYLLASKPRYGVLVPQFIDGEGVRFIRVNDLLDLSGRAASLRQIPNELSAQYSRTITRAGDVLLSVVGTMGRSAIVPPELQGANIARAVASLRPGTDVAAELISAWLTTPEFMRQAADATSSDTAQPTLGMEDLANFKLAWPVSSAAQKRLLAAVQASQEQHRVLTRAIEAQVRLLIERRQALVTAAVTGQFDVSTASGRNVTEGVSA
ncbi:restriction endonuclease subunit S [Streptomyces coelicoflavus]|uniref:restriction endonuclease subunit S n=1 Tax=Streptomyces coelicoflavus TaxID=285562 RepID=UPI0036342A83